MTQASVACLFIHHYPRVSPSPSFLPEVVREAPDFWLARLHPSVSSGLRRGKVDGQSPVTRSSSSRRSVCLVQRREGYQFQGLPFHWEDRPVVPPTRVLRPWVSVGGRQIACVRTNHHANPPSDTLFIFPLSLITYLLSLISYLYSSPYALCTIYPVTFDP